MNFDVNIDPLIHKSIKVTLNSIIKNKNNIPIIDNYVCIVNKIITRAYELLKIIILEAYDNNKINDIKINRKFIDHLLSIIYKYEVIKKDDTIKSDINKKKKGKKKNNNIIDDEFIKNTYNKYFQDLKFEEIKLPLANILKYCSIEITTCLENNITNHFKDYINKYINLVFCIEDEKKIYDLCDKKKDLYNEYNLLENKDIDIKRKLKEDIREINLKIKEINDNLKDIKKELINVKLDLYTNSAIKYPIQDEKFKWIEKNRKLLVPFLGDNNINFHLKKLPLDFLKYSIYINKEIEKMIRRPYQVIPQRTTNIPCNIILDATCITYMFRNQLTERCKEWKENLINILNSYMCLILDTGLEKNKKVLTNDILNKILNDNKTEENEKLEEDYKYIIDKKCINIINQMVKSFIINPELMNKKIIISKNELEIIRKKMIIIKSCMKKEDIEVYNIKINMILDNIKVDKIAQNPELYGTFILGEIINYKNRVFKGNKIFNNIFRTDGISITLDFVNIKEYKYAKKIKEKNDEKEFKLKELKKNNIKKTKKKKNEDDFLLENLTDQQIKYIIENCIVLGDDPGKRFLATLAARKVNLNMEEIKIMGKNNKDKDKEFIITQYSSKRWRNEVSGKKILENIKNGIKKEENKEIKEIENKLSKVSSRTLNQYEFMKYIKIKEENENKLKVYYGNRIFKKYKFTKYINKKQEEGKFIREIRQKYLGLRKKEKINMEKKNLNREKNIKINKLKKRINSLTKKETRIEIEKKIQEIKEDTKISINEKIKEIKSKEIKKKEILIGIGNWGRNSQMSGFFPTPNKWFKKLLGKNFRTIIVNENNTSKMNYRTEKEGIHVKYKTEDGKEKEAYSVLSSGEKDEETLKNEKLKLEQNKKLKKTNNNEYNQKLTPQNTNSKEEISRYKGVIDRDYNGSINILKIIEEYLRTKKRPKYLITKEKETSIELIKQKPTKASEKRGRQKKCTVV